jgi:hypothetical protein
MRQLILAGALALIAPVALSANSTAQDAVPAQEEAAQTKGLVSWKTLAQVEEAKVNSRLVPKFSPQITALDGKEVKLQGFMMPLDSGAKQKRFLLSANVPSCPFCIPGGPDSLIEVLCRKPIAFNMAPIVISGKLSVLKDDPGGLWYRLTDATMASDEKM